MARSNGTLRVLRHHATYRVPKHLNDPAWRDSLDDLLQNRLHNSLRFLLTNMDSGDDVWLIRTLSIDSKVGLNWDPQQITDQIARQIATELFRTIDQGADGKDVLWFPNRAAYLGRFLSDCAEGKVNGRWEYNQFSKWSNLTPSATVREVTRTEPEVALEALINVLPGELRAILHSLTPQDADEILRALSDDESEQRMAELFQLGIDVLTRLQEESQFPADARQLALTLFLEVVRKRPQTASRTLERMVRDLGALAIVVQRGGPSIVNALLEDDWSGLSQVLGASRMAQLAGFLTWPVSRQRQALEALAKPKASHLETPSSVAESISTRLGGMFLLLPLLDEFPWAAATAGWAPFRNVPATRMAQYLTMIGTFGQRRNGVAASDAALRLALGIDSQLDGESVAKWAKEIPRRELQKFWRVWVEHLRKYGKITLENVSLVNTKGSVFAVDSYRGIWVGAVARTGVKSMLASLNELSEISTQTAPPTTKLNEEVEFAMLDSSFQLPAPVRRLLMLTSQALLRELAWRLPGFSKSSLPHLFTNFLDFPAKVQIEENRYLVHLQNPPLHLVLSLTGMNRRQFRLDATGGKEWVLTQAP